MIHSHNMELIDVPPEIVEKILLFVSPTDILNFSFTCKQFYSVCKSNELWHQQMKNRWVILTSTLEVAIKNSVTWKAEYERRANVYTAIVEKLNDISTKYYRAQDVTYTEFDAFYNLMCLSNCSEHVAELHLLDSLNELVFIKPSTKYLSLRFYAHKVIRYIIHKQLKLKWLRFLRESDHKPITAIEDGALMICSWCQTGELIDVVSIQQRFDDIAREVKESLRQTDPTLPIFRSSQSITLPVGEQRSCWDERCCRRIISGINHVLFKHIGPATQNYYNVYNSYLDKVFRTKVGIPMSLCIIYSAVARRLGLACHIVNFPYHVLLRVQVTKPVPNTTSSSESSHTAADDSDGDWHLYIDTWSSGRLIESKSACVNVLPLEQRAAIRASDYHIATPVEVCMRMLRNLMLARRQSQMVASATNRCDSHLLVQNVLELMAILNPKDVEARSTLCRIYISDMFNLHMVSQFVGEVINMLPDHSEFIGEFHHLQLYADDARDHLQMILSQQPVPKRRDDTSESSNVLAYAVGMIMKHRRYDYKCVIYGWDKTCKASEEWIAQMGVDTLPNGRNQPFYNVLGHDNSTRYASQENLSPVAGSDDGEPSAHRLVGKYFSQYVAPVSGGGGGGQREQEVRHGRSRSYYVPIEALSEEYPDDGRFVQEYVRMTSGGGGDAGPSAATNQQ